MRILAIASLVLMFVSIPTTDWDGRVMVDPNGVHYLIKGDHPKRWSYPERGYVLGIPIWYSQLSQQALEDLPGIGPSLATKIMGLRMRKAQVTWRDIDAISGIGRKKLLILQDAISLSD